MDELDSASSYLQSKYLFCLARARPLIGAINEARNASNIGVSVVANVLVCFVFGH